MAKGENPAKRSNRYANELKSRRNSFTGSPLSPLQAGFRMGVLNERKWSNDIYKYKKNAARKSAARKK